MCSSDLRTERAECRVQRLERGEASVEQRPAAGRRLEGLGHLHEVVDVRRAIAGELRRFLDGQIADRDRVLALSKRYGELDGAMSYLYATAFARIGQSLTARQRDSLSRMRSSSPDDPRGPFLYSTPIVVPQIASTAFLFGVRR